MKFVKDFLVVVCLIFLSASPILAAEKQSASEIEELKQSIHEALPEPAEGYQWALFRGVAIQRPSSWNEFSKDGVYCSSIESVPEKGIFETGVTIQVYRDISDQYKISPTLLAVKYVQDFEKKDENTELIFTTNSHPDGSESILYRFKNAPANLPPIIVHKYLLINEKEDFVSVVTFETTEDKWEQYWENEGTTILGAIVGIPYFE